MADVNVIYRAIDVLDGVENGIEASGTDVPDGTKAEEYENLIKQIGGQSGSKEGVILQDVETGITYNLYVRGGKLMLEVVE